MPSSLITTVFRHFRRGVRPARYRRGGRFRFFRDIGGGSDKRLAKLVCRRIQRNDKCPFRRRRCQVRSSVAIVTVARLPPDRLRGQTARRHDSRPKVSRRSFIRRVQRLPTAIRGFIGNATLTFRC